LPVPALVTKKSHSVLLLRENRRGGEKKQEAKIKTKLAHVGLLTDDSPRTIVKEPQARNR